ncbi:MAG: hypothetical protein Q8K74_12610 [Candidatus Nitrotoga sp.]|nr:hypothetical protein [Candidatus Nitrotoga sp.]MDP1856855.1 hypothetical protein [Candidatus Nitrotoga sp.]
MLLSSIADGVGKLFDDVFHIDSVVSGNFAKIILWAPLKIQVSKQDKARVKNLSAAYT